MLYTNFIGIDIGKFSFVAAVHEQKGTKEYENTPTGIARFVVEYQHLLQDSLIIVEPTGGY